MRILNIVQLALVSLLTSPFAHGVEFFYTDNTGKVFSVERKADVPKEYRKTVRVEGGGSYVGKVVVCKEKVLCGIVVVSSVQRESREMRPILKAMQMKNSKDSPNAFQVVVSWGEQRGQNEEYAAELYGKGGVYLDSERVRAKKLKAERTPKWVVLDAGSIPIMEDRKAAEWVLKNFGDPGTNIEMLYPEGVDPVTFTIVNPPKPDKDYVPLPGLAPNQPPPPPAVPMVLTPEVKSLGTMSPTPFVPSSKEITGGAPAPAMAPVPIPVSVQAGATAAPTGNIPAPTHVPGAVPTPVPVSTAVTTVTPIAVPAQAPAPAPVAVPAATPAQPVGSPSAK